MIKNKKESKFKQKISFLSVIFKRNKAFVTAVAVSFLVLAVMIYLNAYENSGFSKLTISDFEV